MATNSSSHIDYTPLNRLSGVGGGMDGYDGGGDDDDGDAAGEEQERRLGRLTSAAQRSCTRVVDFFSLPRPSASAR